MKANFEALKPDQWKEFANKLRGDEIVMERIEGSEAIYAILTTQNGERYSFQLSFQRNVYGA